MVDVREAHAALVAGLHRLRNDDGGWPYYAGRTSRLEPTCWALLGTGGLPESTPLGGWARTDGLLVEPSVGQINHAFNALAGLTFSARRSNCAPATAHIIRALCAAFGEVIPQSEIIRQDGSLRGWGWTPGTFSWVEPTSWCILLLKQWPETSDAAPSRIVEAERVMRDRACDTGGWNFGNGEVYGRGLPAHAPPTALGVLALQDRLSDRLVGDAVAWLEQAARHEGSTTALALAALALMTVGRPVTGLIDALAARHEQTLAFGNVAAIGMAACALDAALQNRPARAFLVPGGRA